MSTFSEMLNTVSFRGVAGRARREDDLWPLRDILFDLQTDIIKVGAAVVLNLRKSDSDALADAMQHNNRMLVDMLEHDILVIEMWCNSHKVLRPPLR